MNRVIGDFKAFGLAYMRSRSGFFFALIFPVLLILVFGAVFSGVGSQKINLPVQDLDNSTYSQRYIELLDKAGVFNIQMISNTTNFDQYIKDKLLTIALQIPQGFGENVTKAQSNMSLGGVILLKGDPSSSNFGIAAGAANAIADQLAFEAHGARPIAFVRTESLTTGFKYIDYFIPGMIAFTTLTTPLFSMSTICAEYRNRGFFKLLGSTPLTKSEWLAAKILWYVVLMLASIMIMYGVGVAVFSTSIVITPLAILLVIAGVFLFTSLGMFLGVFINNPESASALANAIGFPMMFLSGIFFQLEMMPGYLQGIARALPLTYLAEGLRATMSLGNDLVAAVDLVVVFMSGLILFVISARAMSWKGK